MTDVQTIVAGLSSTDRLRARNAGRGLDLRHYNHAALARLCALGLAKAVRRSRIGITVAKETPLGLAVREALQGDSA